jgi:hypothetical protein
MFRRNLGPIIAAVAAVVSQLSACADDLIAKSRRLAPEIKDTRQYLWLPDGRLMRVVRSTQYQPVYMTDPVTGTTTQNRLRSYIGKGPGPDRWVSPFFVSLDGKWLLWWYTCDEGNWWPALPMDWSDFVEGRLNKPTDEESYYYFGMQWLPDNKHFASIAVPARLNPDRSRRPPVLVVRTRENPNSLVRRQLSWALLPYPGNQNGYVSGLPLSLCAVTRQGMAIVVRSDNAREGTPLGVYEIPIDEGVGKPRSYLLESARNAWFRCYAVAPSGSRIAYVLVTLVSGNGNDRSSRFRAEIWTCTLDGLSKRLVGVKSTESIVDVDKLAWTADEKRLSYVYDGSVWTVPADEP